MDTKELMSKKSRVREAMDWMTGPSPDQPPQEPSGNQVALLEQQLRRAEWKVLKLQNQKQNLSETCASQDSYIAQLAREFEALQADRSQRDQELEQLRSRQTETSGPSEMVDRLTSALEEARTQIRQLEEASQLRQMESDRRQDGLESALREKESHIRTMSGQRQSDAAQLQQALDRIRQLEEAAHAVRTDADRRQDGLSAALQEKDARILELAARQEQMAAQMQEAQQAHRRLEDENHQLQSHLAELTGQMDVVRVQKELADQEMEDLRCLHAASADQQDTIRRLQDELTRSRESIRHLEQTLRNRQEGNDQENTVLRKKLDEKEHLFQKIAEQRDQISLELEDLQAAHCRVKNEYTSLHTRLSNANEQIEELRAQSGRTEEELDRLRTQQEESARRQKQMEHLTEELTQAKETILRQEEVLQTRQEEQAGALAAARQELHAAQQTIGQLRGQKELADERQKTMDRLGSDLEESRGRIRKLEEALHTKQEEYTLQKASLQTDVHESEIQCRTLSAKLHEAEQVRQRLELEKQALQTRLNEQAASSETAVHQAEENRTCIAALRQEGLRREQEVETLRGALRQAEQKLEAQTRTGSRAEEQVTQLQTELADLRNCFQQVLEEKVTLRKQLTSLEEFETKYLASDEANHQMRIELEDLRFRLEEKNRQIERAGATEQESRQRQQELQDKLEQKNGLLSQLQGQEEHLLRQIEAHSQTIEQARLAHEQLCREMELRQEEFDKQCRLRDEQIESLRTKLAEVSNQAQEFERLSIQAHEDNNRLREALGRTEEQLTAVQARLAQTEEENQSMQKQIIQLQISVDQLAETRSQLQKARRYIESMEEMLSRQTVELEMTQKQLNKHLEFAHELQILSRRSEGIWEAPAFRPAEPPKPAQPAPRPQTPQSDNRAAEPTVIVTASKTAEEAPTDMDSRVAALRNQLMEQTDNLRRAHETIRLLREQKQISPAAQSDPSQPVAAPRAEEAEVSWITKPTSDRQTRTAVFQFLEEQETKGFKKQPAAPKPAGVPAPVTAAPLKAVPPQQEETEPDEKTKSLFRKFGLLGGWSANK